MFNYTFNTHFSKRGSRWPITDFTLGGDIWFTLEARYKDNKWWCVFCRLYNYLTNLVPNSWKQLPARSSQWRIGQNSANTMSWPNFESWIRDGFAPWVQKMSNANLFQGIAVRKSDMLGTFRHVHDSTTPSALKNNGVATIFSLGAKAATQLIGSRVLSCGWRTCLAHVGTHMIRRHFPIHMVNGFWDTYCFADCFCIFGGWVCWTLCGTLFR